MVKHLTIVWALLVCGCDVSAQSQTLEQGRTIERRLTTSEEHNYVLSLQVGQFARVVAMQRGIDVVLRVLSPKRELVLQVDSPNGDNGPEVAEFQARDNGE